MAGSAGGGRGRSAGSARCLRRPGNGRCGGRRTTGDRAGRCGTGCRRTAAGDRAAAVASGVRDGGLAALGGHGGAGRARAARGCRTGARRTGGCGPRGRGSGGHGARGCGTGRRSGARCGRTGPAGRRRGGTGRRCRRAADRPRSLAGRGRRRGRGARVTRHRPAAHPQAHLGRTAGAGGRSGSVGRAGPRRCAVGSVAVGTAAGRPRGVRRARAGRALVGTGGGTVARRAPPGAVPAAAHDVLEGLRPLVEGLRPLGRTPVPPGATGRGPAGRCRGTVPGRAARVLPGDLVTAVPSSRAFLGADGSGETVRIGLVGGASGPRGRGRACGQPPLLSRFRPVGAVGHGVRARACSPGERVTGGLRCAHLIDVTRMSARHQGGAAARDRTPRPVSAARTIVPAPGGPGRRRRSPRRATDV
ncbi:hypothetical protein Ae168Ps1_1010c [Pseudonocardia sp. Ae168_Ps1]|nr:hypothetical protein Ae150APs1_1010c [Pseudonocardia sp. Ae150A_Ps1]OLL78604.1 hypothetical protein Ae168Ps1_1010c [Pseudonocardia sp. Ae168_Ps1]OLL87268.1 hypothetical protein Ae263Ps1_4323 [Pseudonocardia sp. Ae263_Ps1]OLL92701.1 hypothetical protein Ae356Ps1_2598c [Pseudonocardia sp. Ae356_Ps1]